MGWINEFRKSLKSVDVEEIIDLIFFRPISFVFVKIIYNTSITPNQISVLSMLTGIAAGIAIAFGNYTFFIAGGFLLMISNVLDCADGQLARLKQNGTKIGRIIDGFIDYVTGFSFFAGAGVGLSIMTGNILSSWLLVAAAGASRIFQNMYFDNFRNDYLKYVYDKGSDLEYELTEFKKFKEVLNRSKGRYFDKFLVEIYIRYSSVQKKGTQHKLYDVTPEEYKRKNKFVLRLWSWLGSTTHLAAAIIFLFLNRLEYYMWTSIIIGNLLLIVFLLVQKKALSDLKKKL